ncbi:c-type cytochrome [Sphingomonas solaris]|uniref:Cytochrome c n=1 Tax=Alterirhizorhabdus solaris TaxID=2529389 RepID=A0A558R8X2_9SPHN|nr:cytochrome c [Sphingomonas solaris]TVV75824.1 cytochrome c [Sphingomonas solaris]
MTGFDMRTAVGVCLGISVLAGMGLAGSSATGAAPVAAAGVKGDPIYERKAIMQRLDEEGEVLGNIVAGIEPPERLAEVTRTIANDAKESTESFRTIAPGGRSRDEVWSNHDDFMKRMENFSRNAEAMAKAGETGNMAAVTSLMVDAMPCKQCHDTYRAPKKPS